MKTKEFEIGSTKLVIFKKIVDGALILDRDGRVLYMKAREMDMGDEEQNATILRRLADPNYERQFAWVKVNSPKFYRMDWIEDKWKHLKDHMLAWKIYLRAQWQIRFGKRSDDR